MKSVPYPRAEWRTAIGLAVVASSVALLPPIAQLWVTGIAAALLLLVRMVANPVAWLGLFLGAVLVLPPLPLSWGNSGAHPALALAVVGIYTAAIFAHRWRWENPPVGAPLIALAACLIVSVPMALIWSGMEVGMGSAVRVALFAVAPFVFFYVVAGPGRVLATSRFTPATLLFAGGVISAVFACIDFFYQLPAPAGYSPQFIWLADRVLRRAQGLFYDSGALGNMCAFFLVMVAAVVVSPGIRGRVRWVAVTGSIPLAAALVFSYSRASALNVLVSLGAMGCIAWRRVRWMRTALVVLVMVAVVGITVSSIAPGLAQWWWQRALKTSELAFSASDAALSGRVSSWEAILSFTMEHPARVILGVGYKTLPYSDVLGRPVIADNTYLSTFIETGIAGLLALCAVHLAILRATLRAARSADAATAFYGLWTFSFWVGEIVQMSAADLLTYWRLLPVFFFAIAMAVLRSRERTA